MNESTEPENGTALAGRDSSELLDAGAFEEAVAAFLSEWEEYFGEDPRGPIADNIETLLAPALLAYVQATN